MNSDSSRQSDAVARLQLTLWRNRHSSSGGVYAVCSAHPAVIEASVQQAREDGVALHVESTSSQVNQEGGYTGQTPQQFAEFIHCAAARGGLASEQVLLGGDHLGPFPWREQKSPVAMEKACALVRACVCAGYQKIHLDASMPCADDGVLEEQTVAQRAAIMAEASEKAFAGLPIGASPPVYVIGTEVPAPGGETKPGEPPAITSPAHAQHTLDVFHSAFAQRGLSAAWERTVGLVVQPGVEFGDDVVFTYDRPKARALSQALPKKSSIVYEAHSTDYQSPGSLKEMVEDHFAILKVGPALTFAYREAIFALGAIERELLGTSRSVQVSNVPGVLDQAMLRSPKYWRSYYHGDEERIRFSRAHSYSDRCRYYWPDPEVQEEVKKLFANLEGMTLPATILSQFLPLEYEAVRADRLKPTPNELTDHHIRAVLKIYAEACGMRLPARD
jgi:D-tagatose-1,6-bisphosphate aldolase subunit GatZ/KbaZ